MTASEYQPEGYVFLATPNIKSGEIDFENVNYINKHRYEESPELKLHLGDVLLAKDGMTLGITNIVRDLPSRRQSTAPSQYFALLVLSHVSYIIHLWVAPSKT